MKPITEDIHDQTVAALDRLIAGAYEAKENFLLKRFEEAASELDEIDSARKKAEALINEMWE